MTTVTIPSTLRGTYSGAQINALSTANIPALTTSQISALSNISISLGGTGGGGTGGGGTGSTNTTWASPAYPTISNTNGAITNNNLTVEPAGKLRLAGRDPDILIGDISLKETLTGIQQQLGILQSNKGLEERWEKLRKIKQEYDACVADLVEKETMWNELKR
jgi:hypothetical protein